MSFFQNPFLSEFRGNWVLADRHHIPAFVVPGNKGRGEEVVSVWNQNPPYNLSGNDADGNTTDTLVIRYALRGEHNWATLSIDITAGAVSDLAVTPQEIASALNANTTFAGFFQAVAAPDRFGNTSGPALYRVSIKQKKPITEFRFYIVNGRAEEVLQFNARAGVAELPTYFDRHTVDNAIARNFVDGQGAIVDLDPVANAVDAAVIDNAVDAYGRSLNFDSGTVRADWELLEGRSGLFQFSSASSDATADSTSQTLVYPAGAKAGDLAKKTIIVVDSTAGIANTFEIPYTLTSGDLITPP